MLQCVYVLPSAVVGFKLDEEAMKVRTPLLQKYIDAKPDREAMALSSLEDLMAEMKHPAREYYDRSTSLLLGIPVIYRKSNE